MSTRRSIYGLSQDEIQVCRDLAFMVINSKQNVGQRMRDYANTVKNITGGLRTIKPSEKGLEPNEVCLMCGTQGKHKERKTRRAVCHKCREPFTRLKPWRLLRGRRYHVDCLK